MQKGFDYTGISVIPMCHDGNGRYLMSLRGPGCRDEHGTWEPVGGGGVRFGESLEEAVRREILEEVNANCLAVEMMGFREVHREHNGKKTHWIAFDFRAEIDLYSIKICEPNKCLELRWCSIDEIPDPMHSQFPLFLEKYKTLL